MDKRDDIEERAKSSAEVKINEHPTEVPGVSINEVLLSLEAETSISGDDEESEVMPMASAFAVARDPLGIMWEAEIARTVQVDLSALTLTVETIGFGTGAVGLFGADGIFIDETTDIDLSEEDPNAKNLYDFYVAITSFDGNSPIIDILDLEVFDNEVFDSEGNMGIVDVENELKTQFKLIDENTFGFMSDYSFTVMLPSEVSQSSESVLFLRDFSGGASLGPSVPEPTSKLALLAIGTLGVVSTLKRKLIS